MEHPSGKEIQVVQIKALGSCMSPPKGLNFYIVIYREVIKKSSSQEPIGQFQPNLAENMPDRWEYRFVQIKGLALFGAQ